MSLKVCMAVSREWPSSFPNTNVTTYKFVHCSFYNYSLLICKKTKGTKLVYTKSKGTVKLPAKKGHMVT